ncbi:MAG: response regulator [Pseudomonadota bacterium]
MSDGLILIVDDNEPTRALMSTVLTSVGYDTIQAIDGGSAIKVIQEHPVACAIVDQYMEPMGGFDMAKKMQDNNIAAPPMVLVTAHETTDLLTKGTELGFRQILQKPVEPNRLVMTVERMLKIK